MLRIDARVFGLMHKLIDRCLALSQITVSSILMIPLHCIIYVFYWINAFLGVLRMAVLLFDVEWSYCNHRHRRQRKKKYQSLLSVHGSRHGGVHFPLLSPASLHQRLPFPNQPEPVQLLLTLCSTQTDSDNRFIHRLCIGLLIAKLCAHRESPDVVLDLHVHTSSYSLRPHPASNTKLIHSSLASVDNHVVLNA